jgi:hypothetical protein
VLDLLTANWHAGDVSVLLGNGHGGFSPPTSFPVGDRPTGMSHGDFDGDCVYDLAVSLFGTSEVVILLGDGVGGFGYPDPFAVGTNPTAMVMEDFNGDLRFDLAVANTNDDDLSVLLNDSPLSCSSFVVRRSGDPRTVREAPAHESVTRGPHEESRGVLGDGFTYYYVMEHGGGVPLRLSVHANVTMDTVRLGFDDGDAYSAPAHAGRSQLSVLPATIPADGETAATVTFTPRDYSGVPLGTGLDVSVDEDALRPGQLAGPLQDRGDGTYSFQVVSTSTGTGRVRVTVEGGDLAQEPTIGYVTP